jgi:hypothetical protein
MFKYYIEEREVDLETFIYNIGQELDTKLEIDFDNSLDSKEPIIFEGKVYTYSKAFKHLDFNKYLGDLNAYKITNVIRKVLEMQKTLGTHIGMYKYQVVKGDN